MGYVRAARGWRGAPGAARERCGDGAGEAREWHGDLVRAAWGL